MEKKILLSTLNPFIICNICKGYLIDATAISECLHTFCKSCLIKHLEANTACPTCNIVIHHSYPRQYINYDRTMQDIVFKLVPGLLENETKREQEFYSHRGLSNPKDILNGEEIKDDKIEVACIAVEEKRKEEFISICLECYKVKGNQMKKMFVRVPTKTSILHVKKFIARVFFCDTVPIHKLDVVCNFEVLQKDDTLKYVYLTKWKFDNVPLVLQCRSKREV